MSKFVLKQYNDVVGKIKFFKLIEDAVCHWDNFCIGIEKEGTWSEQLVALKSRMNELANLQGLPKKKFRDITPKGEKVKEYEIKTDDLRAYAIKDKLGNLVIFAGKKTSQDEDINIFRAIKKRYLESEQNGKRRTS